MTFIEAIMTFQLIASQIANHLYDRYFHPFLRYNTKMSWEKEGTGGGYGGCNDGYGGGNDGYGGNSGGANLGACFNCGQEGYVEVCTVQDESLTNISIAT